MADVRSAQFISLFNGLVALAIASARRGDLTPSDVKFMHSMMFKPLDLTEHADDGALEQYRSMIDGLMATILDEIERRSP